MKFKKGEVVEFIGMVEWPELNGEDAVIETALGLQTLRSMRTKKELTGIFYSVVTKDGIGHTVLEANLKPKKPPTQFKGEQRIAELFLPNGDNSLVKNEKLVEERDTAKA
jgi:hypothetical protein